jgi:predicted house-cleaning noncanonical NTP pyrophosphatase (MazG superfamily)
MTLHRFKLEKLVRDKVPDIMRKQGAVVHDRIMNQEEKIIRLKEKLLEEANEVITEANTIEEFLEEFSDVIEVINALAATIGITPEQIEKKRQEKQAIKGGFEKGIYCSTIEADSNNQDLAKYIAYFKNHPRYTEVK